MDLIATLTECSVFVELCLLRLQKAQYFLLAHSNQAELLLAHWDFFQSSRLPLHHWQQVWKQQTHSQEVLHGARFYSWKNMFGGVGVFYSNYSHHSGLHVSHILKSWRGANIAENSSRAGSVWWDHPHSVSVKRKTCVDLTESPRRHHNCLVWLCHQAR